MPTFSRGEATTAYDDTGAPRSRPDAPTIVFGHGLLFGGWMFRRQIDGLRDDYRCITLDWRGQGQSPRARAGYDMDTLTDDAVGLIDRLGTAPVHWVGLSMGGFVGMRVAARRPRSIRSLVLLNTSADREPLYGAVQDLLLAQIYRWAGIGPVQRQVENILFGATFRNAPEGRRIIDEWVMKLAESDRRGIAAAVVGVLTRKAVSHELCRITAPTLVIAGEQDKAIPIARGRRIAQAIAGARFELVPLAGHSSTLEQPEIVTALLRNFLARALTISIAEGNATRGEDKEAPCAIARRPHIRRLSLH